jgi:hypothetical protein
MELSEVFWVSFITIVSGCTLKILSYGYKSKCNRVEVGCIRIERDIEQEQKNDEMEMNKLQRTASQQQL